MLSKKYRQDYQLEYERGPSGHLRETASYVGGYFAFDRPLDALRRIWLPPAVAAMVFLLVQLWFTDLYGPELRTLSLPAALSAPAFFWAAMGVGRIAVMKENQMTRQAKDRICNRLPAGALVFLICSVLAFGASLWGLAALGFSLARALYALDAACQAALALLLFLRRKTLAVHTLP